MKSLETGVARVAVMAIALTVVTIGGFAAQGSVIGATASPVPRGALPQRSSQDWEVEARAARTNLVGRLEAALGSDFGGVWFEPADAQVLVGVTSPAARRNAEAVAAEAGLTGNVTEISMSSSWAQLEAAQDRWNRRLDDLFDREEVQTSLAPDLNAVQVKLSSAVPRSTRVALERAASADSVDVLISTAPQSGFGAVDLGRCEEFKSKDARCNPTLVAGVTIESAGGGRCTAGPTIIFTDPVSKAVATDTYLLTAGHCIKKNGGNGEKWYAYNKAKTKEEIGVAFVNIATKTDIGMIEIGTKYWANANNLIPVVPTVASWDSSKETDPTAVQSEAVPMKDGTGCFSGQRSGTKCGTIKDTGITGTVEGEKVENLIEADLGKSKAGKGDSGAPWFSQDTPSTVQGVLVAAIEEGDTEEGKIVFLHSLKTALEKLKEERAYDMKLLTQTNEKRHPKLKAGKYPVTIHGTTSVGQKFTTEAGSVECKSSSFHAVLSESGSSTLTVKPEYKECKASFLESAATISMEECSLVFHVVEKTSTDNYKADTDVSCPAGKSIKIAAATCKAEIKAQTERQTVDLVDDTGASPKKDITVRPTLTGIAYTVTQDGFLCPFSGTGEKSGGQYTSGEGVTLTGQSTTESSEKIDIEIADE